jgi:hypothetical protein
VVILTGDSSVDTSAPSLSANPAFLDKYADGFRNIGMTPDAFAQAFSVPIRIRPTSLRGH